MIRLASTLFASEPGTRIGIDHGALMARSISGSKTRVPMEGIEGVVLIGGSSITSEAIARCVRSGVRVASLTRSGRVRFVCSPPTSGNVHLRIGQLRLADRPGEALEVARWVVAGKLNNSIRLARRWLYDAQPEERQGIGNAVEGLVSALGRVQGASTGDHLRGVEGTGARWSFRAMSLAVSRLGDPFSMQRRSRRPPGDPLNATLGFGYGILVSELSSAADVVGLDPQVGFLHGVRSGRPSLALDLLEEFRAPLVDRFVVGALRRRQITLQHFVETPGGAWFLTDDGRRLFLDLFEEFRAGDVPHDLLGRDVPRWSLPVLQATIMARYLRGDLPAYVPWQAR